MTTGFEIVCSGGGGGGAVADDTEIPTNVPSCVLGYEPSVVDQANRESVCSIGGDLQNEMCKGIQPTFQENSNSSDEFEWFPDGRGLADKIVAVSKKPSRSKGFQL